MVDSDIPPPEMRIFSDVSPPVQWPWSHSLQLRDNLEIDSEDPVIGSLQRPKFSVERMPPTYHSLHAIRQQVPILLRIHIIR